MHLTILWLWCKFYGRSHIDPTTVLTTQISGIHWTWQHLRYKRVLHWQNLTAHLGSKRSMGWYNVAVADGIRIWISWPERGRDSLAHASSRQDHQDLEISWNIMKYLEPNDIQSFHRIHFRDLSRAQWSSSRRCGNVNLCGSRHYHVLLHLTDLTSAFQVHSKCIPSHQIAARHTEPVRNVSFHLISECSVFPMFSIGNEDLMDLRPLLQQTKPEIIRNLPWGSPDKTNLPRSAKICGDRQAWQATFTSSDLLQSGRRGNLHGAQPPDTAHGLHPEKPIERFPVSAANDLDLSLLFPASKISSFSCEVSWCWNVLNRWTSCSSKGSVLGPPSLFFGRPEFSNHPLQPKNTHRYIHI